MSKVPTMNANDRAALRSLVSTLFGNPAVAELLDTIERTYRRAVDNEAEIGAAMKAWANALADELEAQAEHQGIAAPDFVTRARMRIVEVAALAPQLAKIKERGEGRFEMRELITPFWESIPERIGEFLADPMTEAA